MIHAYIDTKNLLRTVEGSEAAIPSAVDMENCGRNMFPMLSR